jgi:hypothetical protein
MFASIPSPNGRRFCLDAGHGTLRYRLMRPLLRSARQASRSRQTPGSAPGRLEAFSIGALYPLRPLQVHKMPQRRFAKRDQPKLHPGRVTPGLVWHVGPAMHELPAITSPEECRPWSPRPPWGAIGTLIAGVIAAAIGMMSVAIRREEKNRSTTRAAPDQLTRAARWLNGAYARAPRPTAASTAPLQHPEGRSARTGA